MKLAIINDTHTGVRNSSDIFQDYQARFYTEIFFPYLKKHGIKNILHLGDYYDQRRFVNFKALNHNRKVFLEPLKANGITMDIIPGNHDVYFKNTNELCSLKELLGYFTSNVNIIMKPTVLDYAGLKVAALPWINSTNYKKSMSFIKRCKANILAAHLELRGFEMMKGVTGHSGMPSDLFAKFDAVYSGHYHTKSSRGNIHYLGSQMEFTWSDVDDQKYFHILDTDTAELEPVKNPLTIFKKVIYNDEVNDYSKIDPDEYNNKFVKVIVAQKTDLYRFDQYFDQLNNFKLHDLKIAESFDEYLGESVEDEKISLEDTTVLLDSYVDAVVTDLDKVKIKMNLRELYAEAAAMDVH